MRSQSPFRQRTLNEVLIEDLLSKKHQKWLIITTIIFRSSLQRHSTNTERNVGKNASAGWVLYIRWACHALEVLRRVVLYFNMKQKVINLQEHLHDCIQSWVKRTQGWFNSKMMHIKIQTLNVNTDYSDVAKACFHTCLDDPCSYDVSTLAVSEAQNAVYLNMPWKSQY